jgi:hypothetical protein
LKPLLPSRLEGRRSQQTPRPCRIPRS